MGTWKTYKLKDVADVSTGASNSEDAVENGMYPLYDRSPEVKRSNRYLFDFPNGAVIVPGEGKTFNPRFARGKFDLHQRAYEVSPREDEKTACKVNAHYLYYVLTHNQDYFARVATGSTVKSLRQWMFLEMPIPLPPVEEQERIAEVLGAYDDLIAVNERRIALLEEAAHRLYRNRFVTHADPDWPRRPLGEVATFVRGHSYTSSDLEETRSDKGILFINLKNLRPFGGYQYGEEKRFLGDWRENQCVRQGDILMGVTDMTPERRLVGHVARVPKFRERAIFSMDLAKIEPVTCEREFLFELLSQPRYGKLFSAFANGATVSHLRPDTLLDEMVLSPPLEVQRDYGRTVQPIYEVLDVLAEQNALLRAGRDKLLSRLLREEA